MVPTELVYSGTEHLPNLDRCNRSLEGYKTVAVVLSVTFKMKGDPKTALSFQMFTVKDHR
jgi:hypothetical protein